MGPPSAGMRYRSTAAPNFCFAAMTWLRLWRRRNTRVRPSGDQAGESYSKPSSVRRCDLAFQVDGPQVGALVGVFVALVRIGGQGEGRGIGTPGGFARVHAEVRHLPGGAAVAGNDVEFVGRSGGGIARIGQEAAAVRLHVHPIVDAALEALLQLALQRRGLMGRARRRGALEEGDPAIVGAEDGRSRHTANLKGFTRRAVHAQEPDVAFTGGGAASPATTLRPGR